MSVYSGETREAAEEIIPVRRGAEWAAFLFLAVFLWPLVAVALIGGFGFLVWMKQLFLGPPPLI